MMRPRSRILRLLMLVGLLAGWPAPASALIVYNGQIVQQWPAEAEATADGVPRALKRVVDGEVFYPAPQGEVLGLTLLVDFSDQEPAFTVDEIDAWLNGVDYREGGLNGSIRDYYADNSNGKLDFQNVIYGFYRASQPKTYYEAGGYSRATELVNELIEHFDDEIDFSQFDNDGDGDTDSISIVYAGRAETFGQGLWPHAGGLGQQRDGVRVSRYMMSALENRLGLYTFAHEVGHMLFGWPDLYGFGDYCIMGNATRQSNPAGINDFYRADQGWIDRVVIDESTNVRHAAEHGGAGYYYVNPDKEGELFFWSNVQRSDENRWSVLRGSGLLFLHFDQEIRRNEPPNLLGLAVVQADGQDQLGGTRWPMPGSDSEDFFYAAHNAEFSDESSPAAHWNDGQPSGLKVYDMGELGDSMGFSVGTGPLPEPEPEPEIGGASGVGGDPGAGGSDDMAGGGQSGSGVGGAAPGAMLGGGVSTGPAPVATGSGVNPTPNLAGSGGIQPEMSAPMSVDDGGCRIGAGVSRPRGLGLGVLFFLLAWASRRRLRSLTQ